MLSTQLFKDINVLPAKIKVGELTYTLETIKYGFVAIDHKHYYLSEVETFGSMIAYIVLEDLPLDYTIDTPFGNKTPPTKIYFRTLTKFWEHVDRGYIKLV